MNCSKDCARASSRRLSISIKSLRSRGRHSEQCSSGTRCCYNFPTPKLRFSFSPNLFFFSKFTIKSIIFHVSNAERLIKTLRQTLLITLCKHFYFCTVFNKTDHPSRVYTRMHRVIKVPPCPVYSRGEYGLRSTPYRGGLQQACA